jgi:hypothetical protein
VGVVRKKCVGRRGHLYLVYAISLCAFFGGGGQLLRKLKNTSICMGAGIAQSVQWLATGWTAEGSEFESRWGQHFSLFHIGQTGSGAHPASYIMGTRGSFPRGKAAECEADHSPLTSAEVKKT